MSLFKRDFYVVRCLKPAKAVWKVDLCLHWGKNIINEQGKNG